ncbi:MAG: hypothetical protein WA416_15185 [Candidatus Sulfotelmatobacter sp.]
MKSIRIAIPLALLLTAPAALTQTTAQKFFDQLKSLTGNWEGTNTKGMPIEVSFRDTAGGSALMSEIHGHGPAMVSMFNLDGPDRLIVTHYCGAGNQPRMQASSSPDGKTITFDFFDGTNIAGPEAGHMQRLVIAMPDSNHHVEEWTFSDHGKQTKEVFDLQRK